MNKLQNNINTCFVHCLQTCVAYSVVCLYMLSVRRNIGLTKDVCVCLSVITLHAHTFNRRILSGASSVFFFVAALQLSGSLIAAFFLEFSNFFFTKLNDLSFYF